VWRVKPEDLHFGSPPEVVGRGTFGLVLLAEYRGTQVAVKRVIPPKTKLNNKKSVKRNSNEASSSGDDNTERSVGNGNAAVTASMASAHRSRGGRAGGGTTMGITSWGGLGLASSNTNNVSPSEMFTLDEDSHDELDADATTSSVHHLGMVSGGAALHASGFASGMRSRTTNRKTSIFSSIKFLTFQTSDKTTWNKLKKDFVEEMRYLSKLRHPCITTVMGEFV